MKEFETDITNAITTIQSGGIILYPTDTIWGIGCDATNVHAIKKIYQLKQRAETKSMIILLSRIDEIRLYVRHPSEKIINYLKKQPTPTTAIFSNATHLPKELISKDGSIAIRIVKDKFCETLIDHLRNPIVSTSANISGKQSPASFSMIEDAIKNGVDYIVQHRQSELKNFQPSSIIKLNAQEEIEKIR